MMPLDLTSMLIASQQGDYSWAGISPSPPVPAPISSPVAGAPLPGGGVQGPPAGSPLQPQNGVSSPAPQSGARMDLTSILTASQKGDYSWAPKPASSPWLAPPGTPDAGDLANITSGVTREVYGVPDTLANFANKAANLPIRGINALFGSNIPTFETDIGQPGAAIPTPGAVTPVNERERVEQSVGGALASIPIVAATGGLGEVAAPLLAGRAAAALPSAAGTITNAGNLASRVAGVLKNAPIARSALPVAATAAAGQVAADNVPAPYAPLANIAGNLLGGGAAALAQSAVIDGLPALWNTAGKLGLTPKTALEPAPDAPIIKATQAQMNAAASDVAAKGGSALRTALNADPLTAQIERLQTKLADPSIPQAAKSEMQGQLIALQQAREQRANQYEIVPGDSPTTAQVAPIGKITQLTKAVSQNPSGNYGAAAFSDRYTAQNAARVGALNNQIPAAATSEGLGNYFVNTLEAMNARNAALQAGVEGNARSAMAPLGANVPESVTGETVRNLSQQGSAADAARIQNDFYSKVDPNGTLAHSMIPTKDLVNVLQGKAQIALPDNASPELAALAEAAQKYAVNPRVKSLPIEPEEQAIMDDIASAPDVNRYRDTQDIMSAISAAKRTIGPRLGYESKPMVRLQMIHGSLLDSLSADAGQRMVAEQAAVAAGEMSPEATLFAKMQAWSPETFGQQAVSAGEGNGAVFGNSAGGRLGANAGAVRATGDTGRGLRNASGRAGISSDAEPLTPNVTPSDVAALRAARQQWAIHKATYSQGFVGDILKPGRNGEPFQVRYNPEVAQKLFSGKGSEAERVAQFMKATNGSPDSAATVEDYLVSDLNRRGIISPDGMLDTNKFQHWNTPARQRTIAMFPDLRGKFDTAVSAQRALDDHLQRAKQETQQYRDGVAKRYLAGEDPAYVVKTALDAKNSAQNLNKLVDAIHGDVNATESLKYHVAHYILNRFAPTSDAATTIEGDEAPSFLNPTRFRQWIADNRTPLRRLFGGQGMQNFEMVRASLGRILEAKKALEGSQTEPNRLNTKAEKIGALAEKHAGGAMSIFGMILGDRIGERILGSGLGEIAGPAVGGTIGNAIRKVTETLKAAGINTTNDLKGAMMLHPEFARLMLQRVPPGGTLNPTALRRLGVVLRTVTLNNLIGSPSGQSGQAPPN